MYGEKYKLLFSWTWTGYYPYKKSMFEIFPLDWKRMLMVLGGQDFLPSTRQCMSFSFNFWTLAALEIWVERTDAVCVKGDSITYVK